MDIKATKIALAQLILETERIDILESIQQLFKKEETDFWEELSQEQRDGIDESLAQIERGEGIPWEDVKAKLFKNK